MYTIAVVLAYLAGMGHGRRMQSSKRSRSCQHEDCQKLPKVSDTDLRLLSSSAMSRFILPSDAAAAYNLPLPRAGFQNSHQFHRDPGFSQYARTMNAPHMINRKTRRAAAKKPKQKRPKRTFDEALAKRALGIKEPDIIFKEAPVEQPRIVVQDSAPKKKNVKLEIPTSLSKNAPIIEAMGQGERIPPGTPVQVDFTLTRTDTAEVVDTTEGKEPLTFVCGQQEVFAALDTTVRSMEVGETWEVPLSAEESCFGVRDPEKVFDVPASALTCEGLRQGVTLTIQTPKGPQTAYVVGMTEEQVTLDINHPLAGIPLTLKVTVLNIDTPSADSGGHGHAQAKMLTKSRSERLEKLGAAQEGVGMCAVCCRPATITCSKCNHVLYCSPKCQQRHWDGLGYKETCHLDNRDFQLDQLSPPAPIGAVDLSAVNPEMFSEYRSDEGFPIVLRGVLGAASKSTWDLDSVVKSFGGDTEVDTRFYRGVAKTPGRWADVGFCDASRTPVGQFAALIRNGEAQKVDAYVNCDLVGTPAGSSHLGQILKDRLCEIGEKTGLRPTDALGEQINIWWGPPGHTEPLHCDANDGTLLQLRGRKKVILFPASEWLNLYPFPTSTSMSWAWSRVCLQDVDVKTFPNLRQALPKRCEVILEEGDALFIPACWAHQIEGLQEEGDSAQSAQHVLSVNRFWKTSVDRSTRWLPVDVKVQYKGQFPNGM
mmetsp:Transcript_159417/g.305761  ORF Transcript_159417/g.305761 Transcript_159417/m.305761 type:complete len:708 (+) Transcript_159417:61-2184(+)